MKKNYMHPALAVMNLNARDVITTSAVLGVLDKIEPSQGGSDPSMEDNIDL